MKKICSIVFVLLISILLLSLISNMTFAHSNLLNVTYDECSKEQNLTGENELWYKIDETFFNRPGTAFHLSHETIVIKYYFSPTDKYDTSKTWLDYVKAIWEQNGETITYDEATELVGQIQSIFSESMTKWDKVYYYSYNVNGSIEINKIIDFERQETAEDCNVIIYPKDIGNIAWTMDCDVIDQYHVEENHYHCPLYYVFIGVEQFYDLISNPDTIDSSKSIIYRENAGAHEIGHVLGLTDLDEWDCRYPCDLCQDDDNSNDCSYLGHHEEALMGYGEHANRVTHITYRDIAGVSITRGFHTDDDHLWMLRTNDDGTKDVICALCNGVRYGVSLTDGKYEGQTPKAYKSCIHHGETNEEMLLVATNGTHNYYKCLYCRHIAEIDIEPRGTVHQYKDYNIWEDMNSLSEEYYTINVPYTGSYSFSINKDFGWIVQLFDSDFNLIEEISDVNGFYSTDALLNSGTYYVRIKNLGTTDENFRLIISPNHTHDYSEWTYYSSTQHVCCCSLCNETGTTYGVHATKQSLIAGNNATCFVCGFAFSLDDGFGQIIHQNVQKVSVNGSYILPNGIIVLVDEDVEAYLNGTLVFYDKDKVPVTQ